MTLGHTTTEAEIDRAVDVVVGAIGTLRQRMATAGRRRLMRVLAAMSGGVDSSVAAALLQRRPVTRSSA